MRKLIAGIIGAFFGSLCPRSEGRAGKSESPAAQVEPSSKPVPVAQTSESTAKIEFDKMEHDFGKIREGEKVQYRFKVKNPGTVPLRLTDVKPSCGCTVPNWTKEPIPPGGEGFVEVIFDSQGRSGEQMKTVTVFANTDPPSHLLRFRGEVIPAKQ